MRIAVAYSTRPFDGDAAESVANDLARGIEACGHVADPLPILNVGGSDDQVVRFALGLALLEVPGVDVLVTIDAPALWLRHPRQIAWITTPLAELNDIADKRLTTAIATRLSACDRVFIARPDDASLLPQRVERHVEVLPVPRTELAVVSGLTLQRSNPWPSIAQQVLR